MFVVVVVLGSKSHLSLLGSQQIISKTLFKVRQAMLCFLINPWSICCNISHTLQSRTSAGSGSPALMETLQPHLTSML